MHPAHLHCCFCIKTLTAIEKSCAKFSATKKPCAKPVPLSRLQPEIVASVILIATNLSKIYKSRYYQHPSQAVGASSKSTTLIIIEKNHIQPLQSSTQSPPAPHNQVQSQNRIIPWQSLSLSSQAPTPPQTSRARECHQGLSASSITTSHKRSDNVSNTKVQDKGDGLCIGGCSKCKTAP